MTLAVFDQSALDAIIEDRAVQQAMLAAFQRQLPAMLAGLGAAAHSGSPGAAWGAAVHKLRGACLNIGAARLAHGLEQLEEAASQAAPEARVAGLQWIEAETKSLQAVLESCK